MGSQIILSVKWRRLQGVMANFRPLSHTNSSFCSTYCVVSSSLNVKNNAAAVSIFQTALNFSPMRGNSALNAALTSARLKFLLSVRAVILTVRCIDSRSITEIID